MFFRAAADLKPKHLSSPSLTRRLIRARPRPPPPNLHGAALRDFLEKRNPSYYPAQNLKSIRAPSKRDSSPRRSNNIGVNYEIEHRRSR